MFKNALINPFKAYSHFNNNFNTAKSIAFENDCIEMRFFLYPKFDGIFLQCDKKNEMEFIIISIYVV